MDGWRRIQPRVPVRARSEMPDTAGSRWPGSPGGSRNAPGRGGAARFRCLIRGRGCGRITSCGSSSSRTCTTASRTTTGSSRPPRRSTSSPSPATSPTWSARCRTRCRPSCSRTTSASWPPRTAVVVASGNHDLDGPGPARRAGRRLAAPLRPRHAPPRRLQRRHRRHPLHRLPLVGRPGHPRARSPPSWPRRRSTGRRGGCGSTTRRRPARRCATTVGVPSPTRTSPTGSPSTAPRSCCAATSTRRRGRPAGRGTRGSVRPGSSTPASRSARCPAHHHRHRRRHRGLVRCLRVRDPQPGLTRRRGAAVVALRVARRAGPGAGPWWCTSLSRIWSTTPRCPPASANWCFTSTR